MLLSSLPRLYLTSDQLTALREQLGKKVDIYWDSMEDLSHGLFLITGEPDQDLRDDATDEEIAASCYCELYRAADTAFEEDMVAVGSPIIDFKTMTLTDVELYINRVQHLASSDELDSMRNAVGVKIRPNVHSDPFETADLYIHHDSELDQYFACRLDDGSTRLARVYFTNKTDFIIESYKLIEV